MMSEQQIGKKMVELEHLQKFLGAYDEVAGQRLEIVAAGERPDFICQRPRGKRVGVELTRPHHKYENVRWDRILAPDRAMNDFKLLSAIHSSLENKHLKMLSGNWRLPNGTILVVQLVDYTFRSLAWLEDPSLQRDFAAYGFAEIWLADHMTLEPYQSVRLIGLHPVRFWGTHKQPSLEGKPYG